MIGLTSVEVFVTMSSQARNELLRQIENSMEEGIGVRIIAILDRYSGFAFDLELDYPEKNDHLQKVDGLPIIVDKTFLEYVKGMKIEFDQDKNEFSLLNENPQYNCVPGSKYECPSCNLYEKQLEST